MDKLQQYFSRGGSFTTSTGHVYYRFMPENSGYSVWSGEYYLGHVDSIEAARQYFNDPEDIQYFDIFRKQRRMAA